MTTQKLLHIRGRTTAGDVIISPHGEPAVATVYFQRGRDGSPMYDAEANARLFIAAPLMLEALKSPGIEWRTYEFETHRYCPWCDAAEPDGHKADCEYQAAIAAAKPEE